MATSEFWQRVSVPGVSSQDVGSAPAGAPLRGSRGKIRLWMALDVVTILAAAFLATLYRTHALPLAGARGLWHGMAAHGSFVYGSPVQGLSMEILLVLLCVFAVSLLVTSRWLLLYEPKRLSGTLHEQRLSVQACLSAGLMLIGTLYLVHAEEIPRSIVLITVGLVTVALSARRLVCRLALYRGFERGVGRRNVLIVGSGPVAQALRHHLESIRHLGYSVQGLIEYPLSGGPAQFAAVVDTLFEHARKHFVDEIFFAAHCERGVMQNVLAQARAQGVDLRIVPEMYEGLSWNSSIEYIGQFPTIPLYRGQVREIELFLKRAFDVVFSLLVLALFWPFMLLIALLIRLDSPGPVFYHSSRIGKKGKVFRCIKFRTMIEGAEEQRAELMLMNERQGVLFKITKDPRVTRLGRWLRKYSIDELPQFVNVLRGEMSTVGPRPPIGSEVREYKLNHLRRLDVTPGITGLWQVQARQDPSFDSYISLDVAYIENWSLWLDLQIILRTIGVVLAGTGT